MTSQRDSESDSRIPRRDADTIKVFNTKCDKLLRSIPDYQFLLKKGGGFSMTSSRYQPEQTTTAEQNKALVGKSTSDLNPFKYFAKYYPPRLPRHLRMRKTDGEVALFLTVPFINPSWETGRTSAILARALSELSCRNLHKHESNPITSSSSSRICDTLLRYLRAEHKQKGGKGGR